MKWLKWIGIVLAVLVIVPLVTLIVMGHRANAGKTEVSVEINATPAELWTWVDDGDKLKQWVSWLVEVRYPDPQHAHGVGATRIWVMKDENNGGMLMQISSKCSQYAPPLQMTAHISSPEGWFDGEQAYQFVDLGNGRTRMEIRSRFHYTQWFANLMEPLITPQASAKMAADVARLKALVESKAVLR